MMKTICNITMTQYNIYDFFSGIIHFDFFCEFIFIIFFLSISLHWNNDDVEIFFFFLQGYVQTG